MTNKDIYEFAKSCLGKDIARTQDELGCAESVSYILASLKVPGFPPMGFLSTTLLYNWLRDSDEFVEVKEPKVGDIIISPTGYSKKSASYHGHVGVVANYGIMSNNSNNGLFQEKLDMSEWKRYYEEKLGFPIFYFRCAGEFGKNV